MIKENIYVAINKNDEIQWVCGSSKKTRYFRTDKYLKGAVEYHNKYHPDDVWKVKKCVILDDKLYTEYVDNLPSVTSFCQCWQNGKDNNVTTTITRDKAIEILSSERGYMINHAGKAQVEAFTMAIQAMERDTPMKVKVEKWIYTKCPNSCGYELSTHHGDGYYSIEDKPTFCPKCGQRLDWGLEE